MSRVACLSLLLLAVPAVAAESAGNAPRMVDVHNFIRAETDLYFRKAAMDDGAFGKLRHRREVASIDKQDVVRMNRDTLYSSGVFDLDAAPVTITLPDAGKRFMSMQVISEDQYTPAVNYKPGPYTLTRDAIGTRYVMVAIRTLVDRGTPGDLEKVHALQDAIKVEQAAAGKFEAPKWDMASQTKIREALAVLGATLPDSKRMFGKKQDVDPVRFLIGSATA